VHACEWSFKDLQIETACFSLKFATCKRYSVPEADFFGAIFGARPANSLGYFFSSCAQRWFAASAPDLKAPS